MNLWGLIERSLSQRRLSSCLTALSVALGVMLVASILLMRDEMESTYKRQGEGYSLIVGPTGSPLQLVLNSVFHVDKSSGLVPFSVYDELNGPIYGRLVAFTVPYAVGDSFRGYRVVATTDDIFNGEFPQEPASPLHVAKGRAFKFEVSELVNAVEELKERRAHVGHEHDHSSHGPFEAVIGAEVAASLGLSIGDAIKPSHGVEGARDHHDDHTWEIVGILTESDTPLDRVVFINLDSFYRIPDHAGALIPGMDQAGLSSILVFPRPGYAKAPLHARLAKRGDVTVAEVGSEIQKLQQLVGNVDKVFLLVAVLVVIIGVMGVMVAIYNTMNERRRELAILRAIGATRATILAWIVGEAAALCLAGGLLGLLLAHGLMWGVSDYVESVSGLRIDPMHVLPMEFLMAAIVTVAGAVAGLVPAAKAYRVDVARNLSPLS
jgi:putative ABC transport system permease protein